MTTRLRPSLRRHSPGLTLERSLWDAGHKVVVGVDEVGRGAWAGPISVGAVVAPSDRRIYKVRDSKQLTPDERERIFERIAEWCDTWAVGHASAAECDDLGMSAAQKLATSRAIESLGVNVDHALVDGNWNFVTSHPAKMVVGGDRLSMSIAAASILAKVSRDRILREMALDHPNYNFEYNKGYPCPVHKAALQAWGPSTVHRRTWAFMDGLIWNGLTRTLKAGEQAQLFDRDSF